MKHQWLAYLIVAILSIGAGVAIAGLPDSVPESETITPPSTIVAPETTVPTTTTAPAPTTTAAPAPTTTTERITTNTTAVPTESTSSTTPTTTATTTTTAVATALDRAELTVAVANGAGVNGVAVSTRDGLETLGYVDVEALTGSRSVDASTIYYAPLQELVAARLATDLGLPPTAIAPLDLAPAVQNLGIVHLLAYIGSDLR